MKCRLFRLFIDGKEDVVFALGALKTQREKHVFKFVTLRIILPPFHDATRKRQPSFQSRNFSLLCKELFIQITALHLSLFVFPHQAIE